MSSLSLWIFDLDGTIADCDHRLHFIRTRPQRWSAFHQACTDDRPIPQVIEVCRALHAADHFIVLLTGRSDAVLDETEQWLREHDVPYDELLMREDEDHREDVVVKRELLDDFLEARGWTHASVKGVFEDRGSVVAMWREMGLKVFQVDDGKF